MGLLSSIFKRGDAAPAAKPVADRADAVQQLRLRARRRLIGAAVLVGVGVIGFPLLFETQPRPIPVDLPIEIPKKEAAAPLVIPPTPAPVTVAAAASAPTMITEPAQEVADKVVEKPVEKKPVITETRAEAKPEPKPEAKPEAKPEKVEKADKTDKAEAARVKALLDGKAPEKKASDAAGRFIVQVGAYADTKAAHEARMKVERMGLKTYTQAVETGEGKRIRVRVGPFASREEADKIAAKVRGGGLSTAVLTL